MTKLKPKDESKRSALTKEEAAAFAEHLKKHQLAKREEILFGDSEKGGAA